MSDAEYHWKIRGFEINEDKIDKEKHRFLVEKNEQTFSLYAAPFGSYTGLAKYYNLSASKIVGGGMFMINDKHELVLYNHSNTYKGISIKAGEEFGNLMLPQLKRKKLDVNTISVKVDDPHGFWSKV